jgi:hypothetical protein
LKTSFKLSFVAVLLILFGCSEQDSIPSNNIPANNTDLTAHFGAQVSRNFIGRIINTANNPIAGVAVSIGTQTASTDNNGVFILKDAAVYEKFAHITAVKAGYIDGSRSIVPTSGTNNIKIMMIPSNTVATVTTGAASEVMLPSGTKIAFDGAFENESGGAYTGSVSVAAYHLLPSDANLSQQMPGMLYAADKNGAEKVLETFGMLNVELRGSGSQKLQVAKGHFAQITLKIDAAQLATAPSTIPLWHFDEKAGYWKEEGSAVKTGSNYVGKVSHFSWWNCDMSIPTITLHATVKDANGNLIPGITIRISNGTNTADAITDDYGSASGRVPANIPLQLSIVDPCGVITQNFPIGSLAVDTTLPDIVITASAFSTKQIKGTLIKCDGSNVTNGYVLLNYGQSAQVYAVADGDFVFNILSCLSVSSFTMEGLDYDGMQSTGTISEHFSNEMLRNVGTLEACNAITQFISYNFDGVDYFHPIITNSNINDSASFLYTVHSMSVGTGSNQSDLWIYSNQITPGVYSIGTYNLWIKRGNTTYQCSNLFPGNTVTFSLNQYGAAGEYLDLSFSGNFRTGVGGVDLHTISGVAHVIRTW